MLSPKQIDEMARRVSEHLPGGVREFQQEIEKNTRTALQSAFSRMELVTREEFDAQAKVLARTRAKLEALERRVAELEGVPAGTDAAVSGDETESGDA